jgi:CPA2 family monovalent cation:H+ antiporter-2
MLRRLKQPPLIAYMLVGVLLGPSGAGLIEKSDNISILAEIGITLLLFIVGLELSLQAFKRVYKKTLLIVFIQILSSVILTFLIGLMFEWSIARVLVFGFAISISSTAVAIGVLEDIGELRSDVGRLAVGISIAQDLTVPFMIIIILSLSGGAGFGAIDGLKLGSAAITLVGLMAYLMKRERITIPMLHSLPEHSNLLGLMALSFCFVAASMSGMLGLSAAFGAFMAGLILGASKDRQRVLNSVLPIQDLLMMVFFLSVGLLVDLSFIRDHWLQITLLSSAAIFTKTVVNVLALKAIGQSWNSAAIAGFSISQIGEFSFVLAALGLERMIITDDGYKYLVAVIALTLLISPVWLGLARKLENVRKEKNITV